jgi:hypothetical protein
MLDALQRPPDAKLGKRLRCGERIDTVDLDPKLKMAEGVQMYPSGGSLNLKTIAGPSC